MVKYNMYNIYVYIYTWICNTYIYIHTNECLSSCFRTGWFESQLMAMPIEKDMNKHWILINTHGFCLLHTSHFTGHSIHRKKCFTGPNFWETSEKVQISTLRWACKPTTAPALYKNVGCGWRMGPSSSYRKGPVDGPSISQQFLNVVYNIANGNWSQL